MTHLMMTEQDHEDAIDFALSNFDREGRRLAYRQRGYGAMVYLQRMPSGGAFRQWLLDHAAGGWRLYWTCDEIEFAFRDPDIALAFRMRWG